LESALKNFGTIFDIKKYALHDGPGIRTTIFFKGCPLICTWCHNPESQLITPEKVLKPSYRIISPLNKVETIGYTVSVSEMINEINKDRLFYEESGGGVTFSGGEPLLRNDIYEAIKRANDKGMLCTIASNGTLITPRVAESLRLRT